MPVFIDNFPGSLRLEVATVRLDRVFFAGHRRGDAVIDALNSGVLATDVTSVGNAVGVLSFSGSGSHIRLDRTTYHNNTAHMAHVSGATSMEVLLRACCVSCVMCVRV